MGKLGKGCDIVFVINGNYDKALRMGSNLSSEDISYRNIAKAIRNEFGRRE